MNVGSATSKHVPSSRRLIIDIFIGGQAFAVSFVLSYLIITANLNGYVLTLYTNNYGEGNFEAIYFLAVMVSSWIYFCARAYEFIRRHIQRPNAG